MVLRMSSTKYGVITLGIIAILIFGTFWLFSPRQKREIPPEESQSVAEDTVADRSTPPQPQSGRIDERLTIDETLRDVNFCGKTYKVKQILIDGVDVVQRVAELVTEDLIPKEKEMKESAEGICNNVYLNTPSIPNPSETDENGVIQIDDVHVFVSADVDSKGDKIYVIPGAVFVYVNPAKNQIFDVNRFDGSAVGPIGTLK